MIRHFHKFLLSDYIKLFEHIKINLILFYGNAKCVNELNRRSHYAFYKSTAVGSCSCGHSSSHALHILLSCFNSTNNQETSWPTMTLSCFTPTPEPSLRKRCFLVVKQQKTRFYILRRCIAMLLCWHDHAIPD